MHYVIKTQGSNPADYCTNKRHGSSGSYVFSRDIEKAKQFNSVSELARFCGQNGFDAATVVKVETLVTITEL